MSFIDEVVDQHKPYESPISFWYWSALAAVSAVLKDNVYVDRFIYKLYPNIYVMLHADSGLKKGPPVNMAKRLVKRVGNVNMYVGRSSIQGILKDMGTTQSKPGGMLVDKNKSFICSSELTSSIVDDPVALTLLTDLYDRNYNEDTWGSLLKMEHFNLNSPIITMLTATNEAHGAEFFASKDIHGGYFARTFIIHESKRNRINSLMYKPDELPNYDKFVEYLKQLSMLRGEIDISPSGRKYYDEWYNDFMNAIDSGKIKDPTGTLNRFGDSVLKVALVTSLAKRPEMIIDKDSIIEAINHCENLIGNVRKTTMSKGKSVWAEEKALAIHELISRDNHQITRKQLNKKYYMNANSDEWDKIMQSLEAAGMINIIVGPETIYQMPDEQVEQMKNFLSGKKNQAD